MDLQDLLKAFIPRIFFATVLSLCASATVFHLTEDLQRAGVIGIILYLLAAVVAITLSMREFNKSGEDG